MKKLEHQISREKQAWTEIGETKVPATLAKNFVFIFLLLIIAVPLGQTIKDFRSGEASVWSRFEAGMKGAFKVEVAETEGLKYIWQRNAQVLKAITDFEENNEDRSWLTQLVLSPVQKALLKLGVGNEEAYVGAEGSLFYRPGMDYVLGRPFMDEAVMARRRAAGNEWQEPPQPDSLAAIKEFRDILQVYGVKLFLLPLPVKALIYPEWFSTDAKSDVNNPSYGDWLQALKAEGIEVFDATGFLQELKKKSDNALFLKTDTHWAPFAIEQVAAAVAKRLLVEPTQKFERSKISVQAHGDIVTMLKLNDAEQTFGKETVVIHPLNEPAVMNTGVSQVDSEVKVAQLLLGDSFANIYSLEAMGWGKNAGLGEQLSYALRAPVRSLVRNDAGAYATREMLLKELLRDPNYLEGVSYVIWEFAVRELAVGDWKLLKRLLSGTTKKERSSSENEAEFMMLNKDEKRAIEVEVLQVSWVPKPGSVPYKDHIMSVLLKAENQLAYVYLWSMRDAKWTTEAEIKVGQKLKVKLESWSNKEAELGSINRNELDDERVLFVDPLWGEALR